MSIIQVGLPSMQQRFGFALIHKDNEYALATKLTGRSNFCSAGESRVQFYSAWPVVAKADAFETLNDFPAIPLLLNLLPQVENELIAADLKMDGKELACVFSSARFSRGRWYFTVTTDSVLFTDDLRELLPFVKAEINLDIAYGILKYGEGPEYDTILPEVFTIPGASYLQFDNQDLLTFIRQGAIPVSAFKKYFKMRYDFGGASLPTTHSILSNIVQQAAMYKPDIFISGGIDSTLLNFLYNHHSSGSYQAHYIYFGDQDQELPFAEKAVQGTKANLNVYQMTSQHLIPAMEQAASLIMEPVIDSPGSVFVGAFLKGQLSKGAITHILDGTAADSCYGSRDYNKPLIKGGYKPLWKALANEYLSSGMRLFYLPGHQRLFPRDSFEDDHNLLELQWYNGPFSNTLFRQAKAKTKLLAPKYKTHYDLLDKNGVADEYAYYTIMKLGSYAVKQAGRKVYDIHPNTAVILPFLYQKVLADQAKYSWQEKSFGGVVKYPLKKILEAYIEPSFIYRKKMGLNNQNMFWFDLPDIRCYLKELIVQGRTRDMMHPLAGKMLLGALNRKLVHPDIKKLVYSMAGMELWMRFNRVDLC